MSKPKQTICDPLYGMIQLTDSELSMLKTIPVTRMRWIKQMGLACLVFPGANHTRYEHSLGTMYVAKRLVDALVNKTDDSFVEKYSQTIKFAALLHDLGHSPFSHVTEEFFQKNPDYLPESGVHYDHEKYTEEIIKKSRSIKNVCRKEGINVRFLSKLAIGKTGTFLDSLMSSATDFDKIDYVTRDSYFCGLPYGRIDLSTLEDGITITRNNSNRKVIVYENASRHVLEGILMSRFYLTTIIHVDKRNCAANQLLLKSMKTAYDQILDAVEPLDIAFEVKTLLLERLHHQWVDHDLVTFLQDPLQRLKFAAVETSWKKFSSLTEDVLQKIIDLQVKKRNKRYYSHELLNKVLRGKLPRLRQDIPLVTFSPSAKYGIYVLHSLFRYTNCLNDFKKELQKFPSCKGKEIFFDIASPKNLEINVKIIGAAEELKTLYDLSPLMRSLGSETRNRISLRIFSNKTIKKIDSWELEFLIEMFSQKAREIALKNKKYLGSDLILLVYYFLYSDREFFKGDTRFQGFFSTVFKRILSELENPYKELARLPKKFGDLCEGPNYSIFSDEGYPEFFSVKFAQDLDALTEMGLIYTRYSPVGLISEDLFPLRKERRISRFGRKYVENNLLKTIPFSKKISKNIENVKSTRSSVFLVGT